MTTDFVTQFYAPRARLVDVTTGQVLGANLQGTSSDPSWSSLPMLDLISATVTLVNSGVSQLKLTLHNQIFDADGLPRTPPWLYNAFDRIKFGQRVRLDICYGEQPWSKLIVAQINGMQFEFESDGGARVNVIAEDLLSLLKRKPAADKPYRDGQSEREIVQDVISRASGAPAFAGDEVVTGARNADGYRELRGSLIEWTRFTEALPPVVHQKSQTFLEFLARLAEPLDFEIFVDFAKNYLPLDESGEAVRQPSDSDPDPNEVLLHFEPARSRLNGSAPGFVVDLAWGANIVSFAPKLKVWDLVTAVTVKGRNPGSVERINRQIDDDAEVDAVIATDLGPGLKPASELRRTFFADVPAEAPLEVEFTNLGEERALSLAKAKLLDKARELVTVELSTLGFPSLRAGIHVNVAGLYAPFDGLYYVTSAVHSFDSGGYRTELSLRRPGLQNPNDYVWSLDTMRASAS